jgi:HPt (histidine-containing phosphotransfer) domain-containing protein
MASNLKHKFADHASSPEASVFDLDHFARQTFGVASLQQEIIMLFLAQLSDAEKSFALPMTATSWRFLTHTLKGAAAAVGAQRLAELAGEWELAGTPVEASLRSALLDQLKAEKAAFVQAAAQFQV